MKSPRSGLGILLSHQKQTGSEDFKSSQTPRNLQPIQKVSHLSQHSTMSNTRKLVSAERQTIMITEENDLLDDYLPERQTIKNIYQQLQQRCQILDTLITVIGGKDFIHNLKSQSTLTKIYELLKSISITLQQSAKNEIELGFKLRELEKKNIQYSNMQLKQNKLSDKNQSLQNVIETHSSKKHQLLEENSKLQRQLNSEKKSNQSQTKRVQALEKRVEFLLENDINQALNPNDKLRQSLNELLKENEFIKRDLENKKQELERVNGKLNQYIQVVSRLQKTIDNMKKKHLEPGERDSRKSIYKKDDIDLLINFKIPTTLDFRVVSQKIFIQTCVNELQEKGFHLFAQHMFSMTQDQQKDYLAIVCDQLISYKEFAERLNQFQYSVEQFQLCATFDELIFQVNRYLPQIFNCESVKLWLIDGMNGTIYSQLQNRSEIKALQHKGQIAEVFRLKMALNIAHAQQKPLYYKMQNQEVPEYVKNALLIPIYSETQDKMVRGVLEISNTENELFTFDEEYFGILVSYQLTHVIQRLIDIHSWNITKKYRGMMLDSFYELMLVKTRQEFTRKVKLFMSQIFGFSQVAFYFVEDEKLQDYTGEETRTFELNYGLAGMVAQKQQKLIINDVKNSTYFNQAVDIVSILPIFAQPILNKDGKTVAVIETVLKSKLRVNLEKDQLLSPSDGLLGMEEQLTKQLTSFVELLAAAITNIKF
ncbi:hypothetical protein pb186bvf_020280 [Paramecium bursaria]